MKMNKDIKRIRDQADVVADVLQLIGTCVKAVGETLDRWPKGDDAELMDSNSDKLGSTTWEKDDEKVCDAPSESPWKEGSGTDEK